MADGVRPGEPKSGGGGLVRADQHGITPASMYVTLARSHGDIRGAPGGPMQEIAQGSGVQHVVPWRSC